MKIETKAIRARPYEGLPVWRGKYRITETGTGFDIGWSAASNADGKPIAYADIESALAGARVCAQETWGEYFKAERETLGAMRLKENPEN